MLAGALKKNNRVIISLIAVSALFAACVLLAMPVPTEASTGGAEEIPP